MKYTPEKWEVKKGINVNIVADGKLIAGIHNQDIPVKFKGHIVSYDDRETRANANLIASAPEMLELLKNILAEVRPEISRVNEAAGETIFNPVATETIDMAKKLLAKAEGAE